MSAQEAYRKWKEPQKVTMIVYTSEQMFEFGYMSAWDKIKALTETIEDLEKQLKKARKP